MTTTRISNTQETIREQTGQPQEFQMVKCRNHVIFAAQYAAFRLIANLIKYGNIFGNINILTQKLMDGQ